VKTYYYGELEKKQTTYEANHSQNNETRGAAWGLDRNEKRPSRRKVSLASRVFQAEATLPLSLDVE
jgi:hypothetical protein